MGEEEKKKAEEEPKKEAVAEAKKEEEHKKEEAKEEGGEKKEEGEAAPPPPPPPPEEVVMRVFMHCEGCARKVQHCLKGCEGHVGVEEMKECKKHKVLVKGKKAVEDPMKLVERLQKKTG